MRRFTYTVKDEMGLHARPAGFLAKLAAGFECDIKLSRDEKAVSAKRLFGMLGLAVKKGETIAFTFEGADEDTAYSAIEAFCKENF